MKASKEEMKVLEAENAILQNKLQEAEKAIVEERKKLKVFADNIPNGVLVRIILDL
jgi:hypothetical protein